MKLKKDDPHTQSMKVFNALKTEADDSTVKATSMRDHIFDKEINSARGPLPTTDNGKTPCMPWRKLDLSQFTKPN